MNSSRSQVQPNCGVKYADVARANRRGICQVDPENLFEDTPQAGCVPWMRDAGGFECGDDIHKGRMYMREQEALSFAQVIFLVHGQDDTRLARILCRSRAARRYKILVLSCAGSRSGRAQDSWRLSA